MYYKRENTFRNFRRASSTRVGIYITAFYARQISCVQ